MSFVQKSFTALLSSLLLFSLFLAGCASKSGDVYSSDQARSAHSVSYGVITDLVPAKLENDPSGLGTLGGAVVGGVVGGALTGGGQGKILTGLGGAILGALVGTGVESVIRNEDAMEIVVKLDNGETIAVVQGWGANERSMAVGDRVRVVRASDGSSRVRR